MADDNRRPTLRYEKLVRRAASERGLRLEKSRDRNPEGREYGTYRLAWYAEPTGYDPDMDFASVQRGYGGSSIVGLPDYFDIERDWHFKHYGLNIEDVVTFLNADPDERWTWGARTGPRPTPSREGSPCMECGGNTGHDHGPAVCAECWTKASGIVTRLPSVQAQQERRRNAPPLGFGNVRTKS